MIGYEEVISQAVIFGLPSCLTLACILFSIGCFGVLAKKNFITVFMSIEIMLNAVNIIFLSFGLFPIHDTTITGTMNSSTDSSYFVLLVIAIAACEVAVGLSILVVIFRSHKNIDQDSISQMRG